MPFLPCILCGKKLDQRTDKHKKPYFVCDPCGTQFFVRRKQGIEKLAQLIRNLNEYKVPITQHTQSLYEIQGILFEIEGLQTEIKKLDPKTGFVLYEDETTKCARKSLKTRIELLETRIKNLLLQLEEICKRNDAKK